MTGEDHLTDTSDAPGSPSARPVIFGEVLHDVFPDGRRVLGGAPFNVAWTLRGLGFDPLLVTRVGADAAGRQVLAAMERWGLDAAAVQRDPDRATGEVRVSLRGGDAGFEIPADQAFDRLDPAEVAATLAGCDVAALYHGSLALRTERGRVALAAALGDRGAPRVIDVNLRAPWWDKSLVERLVAAAETVKLSEGELGALQPGAQATADRARALRRRLGIGTLVVTRGDQGALAVHDADEVLTADAPAVDALVDPVGAGDAFAAVLIAGRLGTWPLETTLTRAARLAARVCEHPGGVVDDPDVFAAERASWTRPRDGLRQRPADRPRAGRRP